MVNIRRFYKSRHHTTVLHAVRKVEQLRTADESVDALIEVLVSALREDVVILRPPQIPLSRRASLTISRLWYCVA